MTIPKTSLQWLGVVQHYRDYMTASGRPLTTLLKQVTELAGSPWGATLSPSTSHEALGLSHAGRTVLLHHEPGSRVFRVEFQSGAGTTERTELSENVVAPPSWDAISAWLRLGDEPSSSRLLVVADVAGHAEGVVAICYPVGPDVRLRERGPGTIVRRDGSSREVAVLGAETFTKCFTDLTTFGVLLACSIDDLDAGDGLLIETS